MAKEGLTLILMDNLFLFTGQETFLLHEQVKVWKDAFIQKHEGDMNLSIVDGKTAEVGEIISQIESAPFLGDKRLVFIEGLPEAPKKTTTDKVTKKDEEREKSQQKLIDFLEKIPESSVVVFVQPAPDKRKSLYKKIVQLGNVKIFEPLSGADLSKWVRNRIMKYEGVLSAQASEYLISLVGQDMWRIDSELKKLATYSNGQSITNEMIEKLVVPTIEANVFHLTDALALRNQKKAIHSLHKTVAAGENLRQVFYMIVRQFRLFLQIGGYLSNYPSSNPANVASSLKLHPYVAKNTMAQLSHFKLAEIKNAYAKLLEIDVGLKTSGIRVTTDNQDELILAIERFIIEFSAKERQKV